MLLTLFSLCILALLIALVLLRHLCICGIGRVEEFKFDLNPHGQVLETPRRTNMLKELRPAGRDN